MNPTCCFLYKMAAAQAAVCNVRGFRAGQEAVRCDSRVRGAEQTPRRGDTVIRLTCVAAFVAVLCVLHAC